MRVWLYWDDGKSLHVCIVVLLTYVFLWSLFLCQPFSELCFELLKIIHSMSALCSKEYLKWDIIHFCIEISSAVWKLASGEFYFKKKKTASENRKDREAGTTVIRQSRPAGGGSSLFRKLSYIQLSGAYLLYKKVTFRLGKRVLAYLKHAKNIFFLP